MLVIYLTQILQIVSLRWAWTRSPTPDVSPPPPLPHLPIITPTPARPPILLPILFSLAALSRPPSSPRSPIPCPPLSVSATPPAESCTCSRRGLSRIPPASPPDSLQLNLNGNAFLSPVLSPGATSARGAEFPPSTSTWASVASSASSWTRSLGLSNLKWLDLSNNRDTSLG